MFQSYPIIYTVIQLFNKASTWVVIETSDSLSCREMDSLTNVIALSAGVHDFFGPLEAWLEAVPVCRVFRWETVTYFFPFHSSRKGLTHIHLGRPKPISWDT
jgi:hypothetical protein